MSAQDEVRANQFDQWVGTFQTQKVIELGVGTSLLDVGCGIGQYTPLFTERFERVVGIDPSEEYLVIARKTCSGVQYIKEWGESFSLPEQFDTITMNMLLEHVDDPIILLKNCKKHLKKGGRLIAQVPNAHSITRRLGVLMGVIPSLEYNSEKERNYYGHQRVYTLKTLEKDCREAGLTVIEKGGLLYKPLPNEMLLTLCEKNGKVWREQFLQALVTFGKDRPDECADLYIVCQ